jgi:hypothetical protein
VSITLGSALFVAAGVWLISLWINSGGSVFMGVVGVASILFFGFCCAYAIRRLIRPSPAVVIDRHGILDCASAVAVGFIAWEDVAELREYRFSNQTFLGIVPKNLDELAARQPAWKRRAIRANCALGAAPVNIPQTMLPMKVQDLLREVKSRFGR